MLSNHTRKGVSAAALVAMLALALLSAATQPAFAGCHHGGWGPRNILPVYIAGPQQTRLGGERFGRGR
ncbi:MAG TPA: hypothetical protein VKX28_03810 [Xanthobacteraceae bacterium]|nr:hypothetical protein [Xanthobacteraceae bacterium]